MLSNKDFSILKANKMQMKMWKSSLGGYSCSYLTNIAYNVFLLIHPETLLNLFALLVCLLLQANASIVVFYFRLLLFILMLYINKITSILAS